MDTQLPTPERLQQSVIAVPPLARDAKLRVASRPNQAMIRHLEEGGINILLYGGNAVFYHIRGSEYADVLRLLAESVSADTLVVPSIGPAFGTMMDQVEVLRDFDFPTPMVLPARDIADQAGIARGVRFAAERLGKPVVLYLKFDEWLSPELVRQLESDGLISWIKYAVVRDDPAEDRYLRAILDVFPKQRVISGIGEQPAIVHMRSFGVCGFTSGCVCVAPRRSMQMLRAILQGDDETAERLRARFGGLEYLRNAINPIRVLHRAVDLAGIAETGPMLPLLGELSREEEERTAETAVELLKWETELAAQTA